MISCARRRLRVKMVYHVVNNCNYSQRTVFEAFLQMSRCRRYTAVLKFHFPPVLHRPCIFFYPSHLKTPMSVSKAFCEDKLKGRYDNGKCHIDTVAAMGKETFHKFALAYLPEGVTVPCNEAICGPGVAREVAFSQAPAAAQAAPPSTHSADPRRIEVSSSVTMSGQGHASTTTLDRPKANLMSDADRAVTADIHREKQSVMTGLSGIVENAHNLLPA